MQRTLIFDLQKRGASRNWLGSHDLEQIIEAPDGLEFRPTGSDPYVFAPAIRLPSASPFWLRARLRTDTAGTFQIYWWETGSKEGPNEKQVFRIALPQNKWVDVEGALPGIPSQQLSIRIDPPGDVGTRSTLQEIWLTPRTVISEPSWQRPQDTGTFPTSIRSGNARLEFGNLLSQLRISLSGKRVAFASTMPLLGWQMNERSPVEWLDLSKVKVQTETTLSGVKQSAVFSDGRGAKWTVTRTFVAAQSAGGFDVTVSIHSDSSRTLVHYPALLLHPIGPGFHQALFPGIEYLDHRDTSSSTADIETIEANRQVPEMHQPTIPMMAIQAVSKEWISLSYTRQADVAPVFDVPDRRFNSGHHLMGIIFPAGKRTPGNLLPGRGRALMLGLTVTAKVQIRAGAGEASKGVLGAVERWVADHPLPTIPEWVTIYEHARLASAGFLDSGAQKPDGFQHAFPGDFPASPAADVAASLEWLSIQLQTKDPLLSKRDMERQQQAIKPLAPTDSGGIGHIRTMAPILLRGNAQDYMTAARNQARALLSQFRPDGSIHYNPGKVDLGKTHHEPHANGLTGDTLLKVLELASECGDAALARDGIALLRNVNRLYNATVPRGAQTWEVPLHTPDILASAHLLRANVLGYELSGDRAFFDEARYWAWAGIPFVYLDKPTLSGPIGLYATIAVLGATQWVAPNWIGMPVQWCGLVYANALLDLMVYDRDTRWDQIVRGIVSSAYQQAWPPYTNRLPSKTAAGRQGLLPDSFTLDGQVRNDPAINPNTLLIPAARIFDKPIYTRHCMKVGSGSIHVAGRVSGLRGNKWEVIPWSHSPSLCIITGPWSNKMEIITGSVEIQPSNEPAEVAIFRISGNVTFGLRG